MFSLVFAHVDQFSGLFYGLECSFYHLFRLTYEGYHGTVGRLARVNIQKFNAIHFLYFCGDLTDKVQVSDNVRMMVIVGFLGAFTTFSTFEMEIYGLITDKRSALAVLYMLLSVAAGFAALIAGVGLARRLPG